MTKRTTEMTRQQIAAKGRAGKEAKRHRREQHQMEIVKEMLGQKKLICEIAPAVGLCFNTLTKYMRRHGLEPAVEHSERSKISHVSRAAQARALARSFGLPDDLRPRAVNILVGLLEGPRSRAQLREVLGVTSFHRREGGDHFGDLASRGLLVRIRGSARKRKRGPNVYALTDLALRLLANGGQREQGNPVSDA